MDKMDKLDSQLIRVLPACLTQPLPAGWDEATEEHVFELMPGVDQPEAVTIALQTTEPDVLLLDADFERGDPFETTKAAIKARPELAVVLISSDNAPDRLRQAMFSGAEEYLIRPLEAPALRDALLSIAANRSLRTIDRTIVAAANEPDANGLVVGILSGKGGLGKTTLTANMAMWLTQNSDKSTGLISLDATGDAAVLLSLAPRVGLFDLAGGIGERRESGGFAVEWLRQFETRHRSGLNYWQWSGSQSAFPESIPDHFLSALFATCRRAQEITLVDFAHLTADEAQMIFPLLDVILVVTSTCDLLVLRSTKTLLDLVPEEISPRVRVLVNRSDASDMIVPDDLAEAIGYKIAAILPNEPSVAAQSINMGSPFVQSQPNSMLSTTVGQLVQALFRIQTQKTEAKPRKRFTLFG